VTAASVKVRFRKDRGLWEVDYRDGEGRRHRPLFPTEEEAHQHATEVLRTVGLLLPAVANRDITLREYAEQWLADIQVEKEAATVRNYTERLRRHVLPALGHLKVREIQRAHIKAFVGEKRRLGYSKNGVRLMKAPLTVMLSDAVDDGLIAANPALQLGRRKASRADRLTPAERLQKIRPMTWEQRDALLQAVSGEPCYGPLFALLAKAGLRPGEAFALKPEDLDLHERTVRVERAWSLGRVKPTKTCEDRTVDLSRDLVRTIQRHLTWLKAETLRRGWGEPEWLFPNEEGKPLDESRVRQVFRRALKRAGLPGFRVYDLRHTFASLLLAGNAPITYVSEQLGHANPATTLRFYARWIPTKGRRWVDLLDRIGDAVEGLAARLGSKLGTKIWNQNEIGDSGVSEVPDSTGGPSRTRTLDPLIKSQLLCQLS
jgi:integrase